MILHKLQPLLVFQSTPPIRVATSVRSILVVLLLISIHATHTGGDIPIVYDKALDRLFQSTPPIRVATPWVALRICLCVIKKQ